MGSFKLEVLRSVDREIRRIEKQVIPKLVHAIRNLSGNPFPVHSKKLRGAESKYRLRIGEYRVLYEINQKTKTVTVFSVCHRKDAYRKK